MKKMKLDFDALDVQSFQVMSSGGVHGEEMSNSCNRIMVTDPPICNTGLGCTVPDTMEPNRTCTC